MGEEKSMELNFIMLCIGLVICFGGTYIRKAVAGIMGAIWGALLGRLILFLSGSSVYLLYRWDDSTVKTVILFSIIVCVLSVVFEKLCVAINTFLCSFFVFFVFACILFEDNEAFEIILVIILTAAFILSVYSYAYYRYAFVLVSAYSGAYIASVGGTGLVLNEEFGAGLGACITGKDGSIVGIVIISTLILGCLGVCVQLQKFGQKNIVNNKIQKDVVNDKIQKNIENYRSRLEKLSVMEGKFGSLSVNVDKIMERCFVVLLVISFLVFPLIERILFSIYYKSFIVYYMVIFLEWIYPISIGITLGMLVFLMLVKNFKHQVLYHLPYVIGYVVFNFTAIQYTSVWTNMIQILKFTIIWYVLLILEKNIRKDMIKPIILVLALIWMWYVGIEWISRGFITSYQMYQNIIGIISIVVTTHLLFKKEYGINMFCFIKKNLE